MPLSDFIKNVLYINLANRPDRKERVEAQLNVLGIPFQRFNAVSMKNGAVGCTLSHIKCLQLARDSDWDHVLIVEDDIEFLNPELFQKQFSSFMTEMPEDNAWDVLLVGGNNQPPFESVSEFCVKVTRCQTTTGYLVRKHYYDTLIQNMKEGLALLMKNEGCHTEFAVDKYWFRLQEKDKWFLIIPLTVIQSEGYSDIEGKTTNYTTIMLDLDKKNFYTRQYEKLLAYKDTLICQLKKEGVNAALMDAELARVSRIQIDIEDKLSLFNKGP
jgi:GR25 family glycosyltransferase involved in LPS biosynthesis